MGFRVVGKKNQDGKLVPQTKPAIPVFLYDYFFFLPTFFAAFFFAAMFITSDRFMEFHSAIFADGVIYLTDWLYEEMRGAGNDYFNDTFPLGFDFDSRTPIKKFRAAQNPILSARVEPRIDGCVAPAKASTRSTPVQEFVPGKIVCNRIHHWFAMHRTCSR